MYVKELKTYRKLCYVLHAKVSTRNPHKIYKPLRLDKAQRIQICVRVLDRVGLSDAAFLGVVHHPLAHGKKNKNFSALLQFNSLYLERIDS